MKRDRIMAMRESVVHVDVQVALECNNIPDALLFERWCQAAVNGHREQAIISVRIVDIPESQALNAQWRKKNAPTNVLSFPANLPPDVPIALLGDLVLCAPVIAQEAREQNKPILAHWAHLLIHGTLHLLGYDHQQCADAEQMESMEIECLAGLGFANPYDFQQ